MPCYEMRMMSVEFKAKHLSLLRSAVQALGWSCEAHLDGLSVNPAGVTPAFLINMTTQTVKVNIFQQFQLNQLKQQYSKKALQRAAKLQGWQFKQQSGQQKGVLRK